MGSNTCGVRTAQAIVEAKWNGLGNSTKEGESPVDERRKQAAGSRVPPDTGNPGGKRGDHPPSLNTT